MAPENGHCDGDGNGEGNEKTIFVDTSLDTRLVTIVSDSVTVSRLKRKIMEEHRLCFPAIGDISIHSLKVKRRGIFYHLSDSMLVKSVFQASKKNWFLSVDASYLQHNPGPTNRIPLPSGVNNSRYNQADRSPKLCLIYGSPSNHLKIAPFVNQNAPTVDHFTSDDNLCNKDSKNIQEEKSSHDEHCRNLEPKLDQQLDSKVEEKMYSVNKEKKSKKRIRHVHNEDASVKKRCKTKRVEGDIRGSEEDRVLTGDIGKVNDMGTSEDAALDVVVTKAMDDENTQTILVSQKKPKRTKKGKSSAHDQVAKVVPLSVKEVGEEIHPLKNTEASEVIPDVAMVVAKNIQQETPVQSSQNEKGNEHVQEADIGNEVPSSSMRVTVPTPVFDEKIKDKSKSEDAALDVVVTKAMDDEHPRTILVRQKKQKRTKKGKRSAHDQVATVVPSIVKEVGEEIHPRENTEASNVIPNVAMVVETDIQQEIPVQSFQNEKGNEPVQEADIGNEVPSSSMKGVTAEEELLVRHADDLAEEIHPSKNTEASNVIPDVAMVAETNIQQEMHVQSSQKETSNELVQEADIGNEVPSSSIRVTAEEELLVRHADDLVEEISPSENTEASNVIPDVAMVAETNIQQEMHVQSSQKETSNELVQEADIGNEVPSSSMKGVTAEEELLVRHADDLAEEIHPSKNTEASNVIPDVAMVAETNIQQEMHVQSPQKETSNELVQEADIGNEVPSSSMRVTAEEELLVRHADDLVEEISPSENTEASNVIPDVAMVAETNIQQEMHVQSSQKETSNELVQEADIGNEVPSSSMKGVTAEEELLVRHADDLAEEIHPSKNTEASNVIPDVAMVAETNIQQEMHVQSPQKETSNELVQEADIGNEVPSSSMRVTAEEELLVRHADDLVEEISPSENTEASNFIPDVAMVVETNIQQEMHVQSSQKETSNELVQEADIGNEVPSSSMKGATAEEKLPVKHADDLVDMSLTIPTPVFDKKVIDEQKIYKANVISDEKNEVSEKSSIDDSLVYDNNGDDLIVKEVKNAEATESHRSRVHQEKSRKEIKETAGSRTKKIDAGKSASRKDEIVKHSSNDAATGTKIETIASQLIAEIPEKQNENMGDTKKKNKRNRKTKKSTARKEGENGDLLEKIADVSQEDVTDGDKHKSKDAQICDEGLVKEAKKNHISVTSAHFDMPSKLELEPEKSKAPEETMKNVTVFQVPKGNDEGIADVPSKLELEPEISKIPEEATKNVTVSQVPKDVNYDVGTPQEGAREIDFMDHFSPDKQPNNIAAHDNGEDTKLSVREKKLKKKSQQDSRNDSAIHSPSRNENKKDLLSSKKIPKVFGDGVGKDRNAPNNAKVKTRKRTTKIDAPKTSKPAQINKPQSSSKLGSSSESFVRSSKSQKITNQQPTMGQTQVKKLKKSVSGVKSLLNTHGTIFGDNSDDTSANDDATINSDSSTHTPSETSSSGESDSSVDRRRVKRKEAAGKNNTNSQSRLKNMSMLDVLRSSSRFKKARVTASQRVNDTESEPVDFVPES